MYLNYNSLNLINENKIFIEEFFWKKSKHKTIKIPEDKIKLIPEDSESKKLINNPKFVKQVKDYLGTETYKTETEKEKILREGIKIHLNVKEATEDALFTLKNMNNFPNDKKEQEKIIKIFLNRFIPFYQYGNGDQLAWDKKQQQLVDIIHETNDYKKFVVKLNSNIPIQWI